MKNKKMVTSIRIDRELWQAFVAITNSKGLKVGAEIEKIIRKKINYGKH